MTPDNLVSFDREYIVRKWYAGSTVREGLYAPYNAMLHDLETDNRLGQYTDEAIEDFLTELPDRSHVKITIEVIGEPRQDKPRWILLGPNTYGPETGQSKEKSPA